MTIFDDNFWWQFLMPILMTILMTIFDDKFWWQFLDDKFFWDLFSTCDLWYLRHWLQYWQLRTWFHDNLCYLTINCDTGQHSQFLRCFCTFPQKDMFCGTVGSRPDVALYISMKKYISSWEPSVRRGWRKPTARWYLQTKGQISHLNIFDRISITVTNFSTELLSASNWGGLTS